MNQISEYHNIPEEHSLILLILLEKVSNILDLNSIPYFIDGGTLLGAVRHKNRILYDDDVDIGVLNQDFQKLLHILEKISDEKYQINILKSTDNLIKVFVPNMWVKNKITGKIIGTPTLDIFRYEVKGDKIRLYSTLDRQKFKNCYYLKSEFYPLKKIPFSVLSVYAANNPLGYLHRYYGSDCLTNCIPDFRCEGDIFEKESKSKDIIKF